MNHLTDGNEDKVDEGVEELDPGDVERVYTILCAGLVVVFVGAALGREDEKDCVELCSRGLKGSAPIRLALFLCVYRLIAFVKASDS